MSESQKPMTEQMKYDVAAASIAMFQAALEKEFTEKGILYPHATLPAIVEAFARGVIQANSLIKEMEVVE